jgi:arylsulfatase A-like enzyme
VGRSAIVVVIDRLGAGFLGPYGNTWLDTPHFNRLASESLLFETAIADAGELPLAYRAWWTGRHALESANESGLVLPKLAANAGLHTSLFTDERAVAEQRIAVPFTERSGLWFEAPGHAASELEETSLGKFFLEAIKEIREVRAPALVWLHCRGMCGPWDAPSALRQQFADEDDPLPPDFVEPPERHLSENFDPDELLGLVHAYAGQVALADACLGLLLDAIDESVLANSALVAVTSPRGYPLGEHRRVGGSDLFGELVHVPLIVRVPGEQQNALRVQGLVQPPDMFATISEWLGLPSGPQTTFAQSLLPASRGEPLARRQLAYSAGATQRLVRTPAWLLREAVVDGEARRQLYAKPDDRWEANEVSARCGPLAEQLAAAGDAFRQGAAAGTLAELPPLDDALLETRR